MTFNQWLRKQRRADSISDFARDWGDDPTAPLIRKGVDLVRYLKGLHAMREARFAAVAAWRAYRKAVRT